MDYGWAVNMGKKTATAGNKFRTSLALPVRLAAPRMLDLSVQMDAAVDLWPYPDGKKARRPCRARWNLWCEGSGVRGACNRA